MKIGGKEISNWWIIGGIAGAGLVWYLYKRGSSSSSSPATSGSSIDPVTGLPYSQDDQVDPLTGMTYLTEAQEYGSVSAAEQAVASGSAYADNSSLASEGYTGTAGYPTSNVTGGSQTSASYATNAAWAQAVTSGLAALGYNTQDIAAALGLFFAGHPLGTAADGVSYAEIIQAAEAEYGPPPQGTYQIIPAGNGTASGGGSGSGGTTTGGGGSTGRLAAPAALHASAVYTNSAEIAWDTVTGATGYTVQLKQGGDNGPTASGPFATNGPFANFGGLKPKTKYTALVWPGNATDTGGPGGNQPHAETSFTTK